MKETLKEKLLVLKSKYEDQLLFMSDRIKHNAKLGNYRISNEWQIRKVQLEKILKEITSIL